MFCLFSFFFRMFWVSFMLSFHLRFLTVEKDGKQTECWIICQRLLIMEIAVFFFFVLFSLNQSNEWRAAFGSRKCSIVFFIPHTVSTVGWRKNGSDNDKRYEIREKYNELLHARTNNLFPLLSEWIEKNTFQLSRNKNKKGANFYSRTKSISKTPKTWNHIEPNQLKSNLNSNIELKWFSRKSTNTMQ